MAAKNNEAANLILKREPRAAEQVYLKFSKMKKKTNIYLSIFLA